jgi:hypothetical protein
MNQKEQQISIKFDKNQEYQQIIKIRNVLRRRLGLSKLSLRETVMILVNKELKDAPSKQSTCGYCRLPLAGETRKDFPARPLFQG